MTSTATTKRQNCRVCHATTTDYVTVEFAPKFDPAAMYVSRAAADAAKQPRRFHFCAKPECRAQVPAYVATGGTPTTAAATAAPAPQAAQQVRLGQVPAGATVAWLAPMPSSDNPDDFMHVGVVGGEVGMARLGNQGSAVHACPCGFLHNVSRYQPVTVLVAAGGVAPASASYYDEDEMADAPANPYRAH